MSLDISPVDFEGRNIIQSYGNGKFQINDKQFDHSILVLPDQIFPWMPIDTNNLILGAVGILQFDVVAWRLKEEYGVECSYDNIQIVAARWINCSDTKILESFKKKVSNYLAIDGGEYLTYLAPSLVNLNLAIERWPEITFKTTREH